MARVLLFARFGSPQEVLTLAEETLPPWTANSIRVRMRASPINPADFNYIEGTYGLKASLPAVGGLEGVGEVIAVGSDVVGFQVGDRVAAPHRFGNWREEWIAPAALLQKMPSGLTLEQSAVFRVNPATAWGLLHEFASLHSGDWVVQNAATSAVGQMVIAIARYLGVRTLNLVRRAEDIPRLEALGADRVIVTEGADPQQLLHMMGGDPSRVRLGLNAVGGESASLVARLLAPGSSHVTYGAMARQPVRVSNRSLIFEDIAFRGFWVSRWREQAAPDQIAAMEQKLADLFAKGILQAGIEQEYPLDRFADALAHAAQAGRTGKILLRLG